MERTSSVVLDNAVIWPGDGREFLGHVVINDGLISDVHEGRFEVPPSGKIPSRLVDLGRSFLSSGLIDLMLLGGFGKTILREGPREILRRAARLRPPTLQFFGGLGG